MIKINKLQMTCGACPTQFSGETEDGKNVYIRFRFGRLSMDIDGQILFSGNVSDSLDGVISYEGIQKALAHLSIQWPANYSDERDKNYE